MTDKERIVNSALWFVGMREDADGSTIFSKHFAERHGTEYSSTDWCMMFIAELARLIGISEDVIPDTASCPQCLNFAEQNNLRYGADIPAEVGDIVVYKWKTNTDGKPDHVGIVVAVDSDNPDTQIMTTVEGNWNNQIALRHVPYRDEEVYATFRPNYKANDDSRNLSNLIDLIRNYLKGN